jgi:hypothetical protein
MGMGVVIHAGGPGIKPLCGFIPGDFTIGWYITCFS